MLALWRLVRIRLTAPKFGLVLEAERDKASKKEIEEASPVFPFAAIAHQVGLWVTPCMLAVKVRDFPHEVPEASKGLSNPAIRRSSCSTVSMAWLRSTDGKTAIDK